MAAPGQAARNNEANERRYGRGSMLLLAHTFGINHAAVTTPILYQSSYLGAQLGNIDNALLYGITMFTSLFVAPVMSDLLGPRKGLSASMVGYAVYVTMFAVALLCPHTDVLSDEGVKVDVNPGALMYFFGIAGASIGGLAAGILWTCQGVVVGKICECVAEDEGKDIPTVSAELMGTFGWWFLLWEAFMRAITTGLLKLNVTPVIIFFVFGGLSAIASALFFMFTPPDASRSTGGTICGKASKAITLWRDPKLWLLQFTNLTFGFGAAWNASYVGPNFVSLALNSDYIGFMGAVISLIGGFGSKLLGCVAARTGKPIIILVGSLAFLAIGVLSKLLGDGSGMGLTVLIFPVLMGTGRAVYESTNKGVFLDFYPSPELHPGVFGNVMMFGTLSSTIVFILNSLGADQAVIYLLIVFATCTFPGISIASCVKANEVAATRELTSPLSDA